MHYLKTAVALGLIVVAGAFAYQTGNVVVSSFRDALNGTGTSVSASTLAADETGPCDRNRLDALAKNAAIAIGTGARTMSALSELMNAEDACASTLDNEPTHQAMHLAREAQAALYMATYDDDMFGSKKSALELAVTTANRALQTGGADADTEKIALYVLGAANEKLQRQ